MSTKKINYQTCLSDPRFKDLEITPDEFHNYKDLFDKFAVLQEACANLPYEPIIIRKYGLLELSYCHKTNLVEHNNQSKYLDHYFYPEYFLEKNEMEYPDLFNADIYDVQSSGRSDFIRFLVQNQNKWLLNPRLYISGALGSGKTFFGLHIANYLIAQKDALVVCLKLRKLNNLIHQIFAKTNPFFNTTDDLLNMLKQGQFFIFDDFEIEAIKENIYYNILEPLFQHIHNAKLPVMFLSRWDFNAMMEYREYGSMKQRAAIIEECRMWINLLVNKTYANLGTTNYLTKKPNSIDKLPKK
ncbi:hypothetical protein OF376_00220 [Ureaplasma miroungigenitalium]|uniref:Primosomal protein DnaI n=1 Tax=Ureaplasma miroungigenitalium TaxID=1042321 RepID=A0ABT3BLS8_9BACT|nr:hypothetical protein [Ureaplasma miroungigenitalium]MCV3728215.1 hypothetical protein [Ureaplasma miroungigenitalium]MCV3734019.1 hypothetical protein [Ureaplasma miroungigenitalium]